MGVVIRTLRVVFYISAPLFAVVVALSWFSYDALVGFLGPAYFVRLAGALIGAVLVSSGLLMWNEWRKNPVEETDRGEWTGNQLLYSIAFAIAVIISVYYLPALIFSF